MPFLLCRRSWKKKVVLVDIAILFLGCVVGVVTIASLSSSKKTIVLPREQRSQQPTGLLCDFQSSPALGVRANPQFTWIVPPVSPTTTTTTGSSSLQVDQIQSAYQLVVFLPTNTSTNMTNPQERVVVVWNSTKIVTNQSVAVPYQGPPLQPGTQYQWTVTTWTTTTSVTNKSHNHHGDGEEDSFLRSSSSSLRRQQEECHQSLPSKPATFITSLFLGWDERAKFLTLPDPNNNKKDKNNHTTSTFAYFYHTLHHTTIPTNVVRATLFLTANHMATQKAVDLNYFKVYIDGQLVDVGPGRGSAPVFDGDGSFRALPYATLDVSLYLLPTATANINKKSNNQYDDDDDDESMHLIMIQAMQTNPKLNPQVLVQLNFQFVNGSTITALVSDDHNNRWRVWDADMYHQPDCHRPRKGAGSQCVEQIDARNELVLSSRTWMEDKVHILPLARTIPLTDQDRYHLQPRPIPPLHVTSNMDMKQLDQVNSTTYIADFGREFQGGLRLTVTDGQEGQTVYLTCGEAYNAITHTVTSTWGWYFAWTLRQGSQVLEQYKYMECRFVSIQFDNNHRVPTDWTLSAWKIHYPYHANDSYFTSNNAMLNQVYELCRYTLEATSLDTFTDSNTRERQPYEADGLITATARLLVQRDVLLSRHSAAYLLEYNTWPVEWKQLAPFLGHQDYMATQQTDLTQAFADVMHYQSMIRFVDPTTGLLNTSHPDMGQHIVDWMPEGGEEDATIALGEFTASDHHSVANAYCIHGLTLLARVLNAARHTKRAEDVAAQAAALRAAMQRYMWNGTAFCDGICSQVHGKSLVMTNMYTLAFGMIPPPHIPSVWKTVASWGLQKMGDYGAFWYQAALASSYYASQYYDTPGDGSELLHALTKCDTSSWCWGLQHDNLTTTRESWRAGTYSHPWGASAIVGIQWGIVGIHPTAPGFETFLVKPKLGSLEHVAIKTPTIRGYIHVNATPDTLDVIIPCNTMATLCLPRSTRTSNALLDAFVELVLDHEVVPSVVRGGHRCLARLVGCQAGGGFRSLRATFNSSSL